MPTIALAPASPPCRRVLGGDAHALSDAELFAVLLDDDLDAARRLISTWSLPEGIWKIAPEDLFALDGMRPESVARVLACLEVSRRAPAWKVGKRATVGSPQEVVAVCAPRFRGCDRERFWAVALDTRNHIIATIEVSIGSLDASIVHPRELFKDAIRLSASSLILVHNHPSGDATPSSADIRLTRRLVEVGELIGIDVVDHIIIGDADEWTSFCENGLL